MISERLVQSIQGPQPLRGEFALIAYLGALARYVHVVVAPDNGVNAVLTGFEARILGATRKQQRQGA